MVPSAYDVLILGERIFCDLIFAGLPQLPKLGEELHCRKLTMTAGGPANTAIALRRLGLRPGLIADVGNDFFSHFVLDTLASEGVDTALIRRNAFPAAAVTAAFPLDDDRAMATYLEAENLPPPACDLLETTPAPFLHVCGIHNGRRNLVFVQAARAAGLTTLVDCACERVSLADPATRALLATTNYLLPNAAEARMLTGCDDVCQAGETLHFYGPTVVIKLGCRGASAFDGRGWTSAPALAIQPVDTTGAGDCFAAGFILGLRLRLSLAECLRYGNVAGGLSTLGCGATSAPTYAQFAACLAQTPPADSRLSQ
jgi:sugar/nucleoside kinase (ribokinase family)